MTDNMAIVITDQYGGSVIAYVPRDAFSIMIEIDGIAARTNCAVRYQDRMDQGIPVEDYSK